MVEGDGANGVEAAEVVFVGIVCAVPGDDVKGRVVLSRGEEVAREFGENGVGVRAGVVFCEGSHGGLEVACVGEAVGPDGSQFREREMALIELENVASYGPFGERDIVADAARDYADLARAHEDVAELRLNVEDAVLNDN